MLVSVGFSSHATAIVNLRLHHALKRWCGDCLSGASVPFVCPYYCTNDALNGRWLCLAEDWICNWVGNKRWVTGLQWSKQDSFNAAEEERWQLDGAIVGSIKEYGPLSFVKIFKAGHMVGQPQTPRL